MDIADDLRLLFASRYPLIVAEEREEGRFFGIVRRAAASVGLPVWTWSVTRGLALDGNAPQYDTTEPLKALTLIAGFQDPGVFVFADGHHALEDPVVVRRVKEIAQAGRPGQTLVFTAPEPVMPPELDGLALAWTLKPPGAEELKQLATRTLQDLSARGVPVALDPAAVDALVDALRGLSVMEAERLIQKAAFNDGHLDEADVAYVRSEKAEILEAGGALELVPFEGTFTDVGGMDQLKDWLALRGRAFEPAAAKFGLTPPRGVLITGVPGCGKSLVAKTLARAWGMPLVLLDPARLYGSYVGESEKRVRDAFATVEAMAPVVLWVDEIEKGFPAGDNSGDGGVSRRILGTLLRWMQDRSSGVFLVATSNDVTKLPPELLRKGRFDEIFFVDLPGTDERAQIVRVHLSRRSRDPKTFDVAAIAAAAEGFSGAEIEAAVVGALYRTYGTNADLSTEAIIEEIGSTVPLSRSRAEDVAAIRMWADGRAVPAGSAATRPA